ncbi:MAG TPA: IS1380 family transposase [Vicinamibacterales bacterium]|nr:IS1380 family transposase [Vicinamibacterales bacterium]
MATECYSQLGFGFQPKLVVDFAGGTLTTDAGLLLVREFDEQLGLSADVVGRITDTRDARYVTHDLDALVRQRLYQIAAGYEDVNDADRLRHDPTFQIVAADGRTTLGSQPTLSRLENAIEWPAIQRLARTGMDWFCAYAYGPDEHPADLILDLDSTDDPTHGNQQLALFHGFYDQHMYHPLLWFEGRTGLLLRSRLRPGRDPSAACVVEELQHLLPPLRRRFPHTPIFLRGDAGMATPRVEAKLEAEGIRYVLGIGTNRVFKARVAGLVAKAQSRYDRLSRPVHIRTSFRHRAKSWPHARRILVKIDVTAQGLNLRFMVTNRRGRAADLVAWYDDRGASENWIKELKLDIHADRLSCHRFRTNAFRLQLHSLALLLLAYFRRAVLTGTRLASATIGTIRLHLLKVAGRVVRSVRRLWFHLATHWPGRDLFTVCHRALARAPA